MATTTKTKAITIDETKFTSELWLNPEIGAMYTRAERITGPFATPILKQAGLDKITKPTKMLDLCTGTGIVTAHVMKMVQEQKAEGKFQLTSADWSESQLNIVRNKIKTGGWKNVKAIQLDATKTGLPDKEFDHVVIGMALMLLPDPIATINESFRMLKPGGTFAFSVWYKEAWNEDVRDALANLPGNPRWPQTSDELIMGWALGPWQIPYFCESQLHARGFVDVKVELLSVHVPIHHPDDFCDIYEAFIEMVTDKYWTEKERKELRPMIRPTLMKFLNNKYGAGKPFTTERVDVMASGRRPL